MATNRRMYQFLFSPTPGLVSLHGALPIAADATVSTFSIPGIASCARTGTGAYDLTLSDTFNALVSCKFQILKAVAQDLEVQLVSQTITTTKIISFVTLTGASATDATAAMTIYFQLFLRNSSVSY